jgi:hypothetical protein
MSVETTKNAKNQKSSSDQNKSGNEGKSKAPKSRRAQTVELPFLVEMSYSLPIIVILMVDFAVIGFSYAAGADWVTTLSRAMVTTVALGGLLAILAFVVSSTVLAETQERLEKEKTRRELEWQKAQELETKEIKA